MMKFTDITARIRDAYASRFEPEGIRPFADRYWRALITLAFVILVTAIVYGVSDLFGVLNTLATASDTTPPPTPTLNRTVLSATVQGFQNRQTQFADFATNPPPAIPDPSK